MQSLVELVDIFLGLVLVWVHNALDRVLFIAAAKVTYNCHGYGQRNVSSILRQLRVEFKEYRRECSSPGRALLQVD